MAQLVHDVTVRFCDRYIDPPSPRRYGAARKPSRMADQMVQAARSGVQNIAEGSQASGTSGWQTARFSTQARTITLTGLATGSAVQVRARALGGSTGQSDWSTPSSKIVD